MQPTQTTSTPEVSENRKLKVLLSAYSCIPNKGSEPGVGWNMVQQVSRFHEVWVFTKVNHKAPIEAEIAKNPMPNVHWVFVDVPQASKLIANRSTRVHYYLWQIAAYQEAKKLHETVNFDLAHHVTYVSYWTPSFIARLPIPFIWGPVGGAESAPRSFYKTLNMRSRIYEMIRDTVRASAHHFDPYVRGTVRRTQILLSTTPETAAKVRELGAKDVRIAPESGLPAADIEALNALPEQDENTPFRMMSLGRLIGWKGFHLGLIAFAKFQKECPNTEYWVIGDGTENEALKTLAAQLGISDKVHFTGKIPREEALQRLGETDVLVHPSMHDSGGWVCLEAMAAGRPVICLDIGGPATQVTAETGFKIPARTPEQATDEMAKAMLKLAQNPKLGKEMGKAGRQRVWDNYTWDKKGEATAKIYAEVTGTEIPETAIIT